MALPACSSETPEDVLGSRRRNESSEEASVLMTVWRRLVPPLAPGDVLLGCGKSSCTATCYFCVFVCIYL